MNGGEPIIRIGLHSDGLPRIHHSSDEWIMQNLLIGKGFHWERILEAVLPGDVKFIPGKNLLVNILPVETYLECVAASEMNPCAPEEFLKAHAIISRSWVMRRLRDHFDKGRVGSDDGQIRGAYYKDMYGRDGLIFITWEDDADHTDDPFDVCGDDHCQRYQGRQSTPNANLEAIRSTRGIVLTDANGNIADCRFYKACGGHTELFSSCWQNIDYPYLNAFSDKWCDLSMLESHARFSILRRILKPYDLDTCNIDDVWNSWRTEIPLNDIRLRIQEQYACDIGDIEDVRIVEKGPSGRIVKLEFLGSEMSVVIGKELAIRRLLADNCLMSSAFSFRLNNGLLILEGRGWGHGVGLCQIGAARMAAEGYSCSEILNAYYPGTVTAKLY